MTAIAPNTTIYAINVNLNINGEDTILFSTLDQQRQYFYDRKITILTQYSYQREHKNRLKVTDPDGTIDKCNYLMFVNESYENKRMYAFITDINWINNETCEIVYQMDYIQTFLFDIYNRNAGANHLPTCWVERQHSVTDNIGDNIMPENIALGEYVYGGNHKCRPYQKEAQDISCILLYEVDNNQQTGGNAFDGVYSSCKITAFSNDSTGRLALQNQINTHSANPEEILAIVMSNYMYLNMTPQTGAQPVSVSHQAVENYVLVPTALSSQTFDGYVPKNNKLFTYPYNFCNITNCKGAEMNLRYEFWEKWSQDQSYNRLKIFSTKGMPVTVQIRPYEYKGETYTDSDSDGISTNNFIEYGSMPLGTWSQDSFEVWKAQNEGNIIGQFINAAADIGTAIGMGVATENPLAAIPAATSAIKAVTNTAVSAYNASIASDKVSGTLAGSAVYYNTDFDGIFYRRQHIQKQYAETIDNFFSMFGYAQNKMMQPNPEARMYYTYIKTSNINILGAMPQEAKYFIEQRFNNGIRFWRDYTKFLDYTVNNAVRP